MGFMLTVSDLHVGSMFGLFPRGFKTSIGSILALNSGQQYLLECWEDMQARLPDVIDVLNLNGDIVDGENKFEMARGLGDVDPLWQVRAAEELLTPLADRARHIYATRGSTYHVGKGGTWDELLAERLGARKDRRGCYASPWWRYRYPGQDGVYFDIAHRQSTTIRYHSMPVEREMDFLFNRFARKRLKPPEHFAIIRSHAHWGFGAWLEEGACGISTPCWKLQDDFAKTRISPNRIIPQNLGAVGLHIFDEPVDGARVKAVPYTYKHPDEDEVDVIE